MRKRGIHGVSLDMTLPLIIKRVIAAVILAALPWHAWAFDIQDLQSQLQSVAVVRGDFIQEKFLRALPQPLTSRGTFTLATRQGLLWRAASPIKLDMRITPQGIARLGPDGSWQAIAGNSGGSRESKLFLAVLAGDTQGLQHNFAITLTGAAQAWQLTLTPRSTLLQQIFDRIHITGGELVDSIELFETQGDRSVLRMLRALPGARLTEEEQRAFSH